MTPLRVVLAGLGARGGHWVRALRASPHCEPIAWVDPDADARARAVRDHGDLPAFADLRGALEELSGVDAVVLATPPEHRDDDIAAACERRIPMLVEKPLALDLAEAARHVALAEAHATPMMVGLNFRYLPVTQGMLALLDEGAIGEVGFGRFTYERWRNGHRPNLNRYPLTMVQPMLWEQSIHHFDLMRFVYRREPVAVYCRGWNPSWTMYADDTNISALFEFEGGLEVNYQGTWQSGWEPLGFDWRTDGSEGVVVQRAMFGDLAWAPRLEPELTPVALPPTEPWVTDLAGLLAAFVRALRGGPLECSGRDHLRSLAMVEACIRSAREGRRVELAPLLHEVGFDGATESGTTAGRAEP